MRHENSRWGSHRTRLFPTTPLPKRPGSGRSEPTTARNSPRVEASGVGPKATSGAIEILGQADDRSDEVFVGMLVAQEAHPGRHFAGVGAAVQVFLVVGLDHVPDRLIHRDKFADGDVQAPGAGLLGPEGLAGG